MRTNSKKKTTTKPKNGTKDFDLLMHELTKNMSTPRRIFSKLIHAGTLSSTSDLLGSTIFRPNALLFGAILAFSATLLSYLVFKNLGYTLSGSESLVTFLIGWIIGIAYDIVTHILKEK